MDNLRLSQVVTDRPATEEEVAYLQLQLGFPLPNDFKQFLLVHNGGFPEETLLKIDEQASQTLLDTLYGIKTDRAGDDLYSQWQQQTATEHAPPHLLPIGYDIAGNPLYLSLGAGDYGCVYFGEHEEGNDAPEYPELERLYLLAHSFSEFVDGLILLDVPSDDD